MASAAPSLGEAQLTHYLIRRGLAVADDLLESSFLITPRTQRNPSFSVTISGRPIYFVKQFDPREPDRLRTESAALALVATHCCGPGSRTGVPNVIDTDTGQSVLVTEHVAEGFVQLGCRDLALRHTAAPALGSFFAALHAPAQLAVARQTGISDERPPAVLRLHHQPRPRQDRKRAHLWGLLRSRPRTMDALDAAAAEWSTTSLIHGDMKPQNLLVDSTADEVLIVDWEHAAIGHPLWDIAGLAQSWVFAWADAQGDDDRAAASTLEAGRQWMSLLWDCYQQALPGPATPSTLARFVAGRLVQTMYEQGDYEHNDTLNWRILDIVDNVASSPVEAADLLCGVRA